jgi:general secretion pathway protein G
MRRGFTLVELIVVIAIIAILGAVIAPNAFKAIEKARISAAVGHLNAVKTASMQYYADLGKWPTSHQNLTTSTGDAAWDGPYLDKWPAATPWSAGTYTYMSDSGVNWDNAGAADPGRYVRITGGTPAIAKKLDLALDGNSDGTKGMVRYPDAGTPIDFLISTDVGVN